MRDSASDVSPIRFTTGTATEWHELVRFLDAMIAEKLYKLTARLNEKTGRDWGLATGPGPD